VKDRKYSAMTALIFDFDGLIMDTETATYEAWREIYQRHGHPLSIETWAQCVGSDFGDYDPQRELEELIERELDWEPLFPLWGRDTAALAAQFVARGFRAILTCVDTTQLGAEFAGRDFDAALLAALPASVDPCGENGEFHTCVHAGPIFARPLALRAGERVLRDNRFEYCDVVLDEPLPARR